MTALGYAGVIVLGYLLGAIPSGVLVARVSRGIDVREYGSGKTGATNVLRTAGAGAGVLTLLCDLAKGAVPTVIAWAVLHAPAAQAAAALAAMVGHNWPVYTRFTGGRGVSTFVGGLAAMYWPVALACGAGVGLGVAAVTRYMSFGAVCIVLSSFAATLALGLLEMQPVDYAAYAGVGGGLILFQHRDNIQRLWSGTERKLGESADR
ncbi:MAG: glycerol-3-phosphate 1-O-acyltransferase PlsY [Chloroflexi bacterium]|nr:glycerol-3-phosphate 1-O-acyltransferase PlsY [Chloroflexota bacterium]